MTGIAVLLPKIRVIPAIATLDKEFLTGTLSHSMVEYPLMTLMANGTPNSPVGTGSRITVNSTLPVTRTAN